MCVAFQAERTSVCSMIANMAIVYAALTDVFFFKESLSTTVLLGCGGVIIITSLLGLVKSCQGSKAATTNESSNLAPVCDEDQDDHFIAASKLDHDNDEH